ncbi:MAG: 16S rRNA (cytosine(967)-C(5))-methyltransferase RsmB [Desulfuromonadales bacterium]|nr:16S rRNA (cytosine(967)-C(5))-methyltransferase RsmB [Desulfuromonadales bacterium]
MKTNSDARTIALDVLTRVDQGAYADLALDAALTRLIHLDPRDKGLATELVYGVLRQRGRLDFALGRLCHQPFEKIESKIRNILRIGAYQMLQLERVPVSAAVNTAVELARSAQLERATGFINGILRSLGRTLGEIPWPDAAKKPLRHLVDVLSLPEWLAARWLAEYGPAAIELATAMLAPAPFTVRVNTLLISRAEFLTALAEDGHGAEACTYSPDGVIIRERGTAPLSGHNEGWFQPQDEASQLIARLLDPQAGEEILDACSAPGGKTTHIAALTANHATILACDLHPQRVQMVAGGARRLDAQGITTRACDLTAPPADLAARRFDRVLLDAPCSGLGVLRRNPEIRWRRSPESISEMAVAQGRLLSSCAKLVKSGGILLYSVCTLTPEETQEIVGAFLAEHPEFVRDDLRSFFPEWSELFDEQGALATFPQHHNGMDAFWAVRLRRAE